MRAFRYTAPYRTELTTVPQPDPKPGEVLIKVGAAGACHSGLHIIDAPAGSFPSPLTLGHENAGWIEAMGEGVTGWEKVKPSRFTESSAVGAARLACGDARTSAASSRPGASASAAMAVWPST